MALASSLLRPALEPPPLLAQLVDEPALLYLGHRVAQRTPEWNELNLANREIYNVICRLKVS